MAFLNFKEEEEKVDHEDFSDEDLLEASIFKPDLFELLIDRYQSAFLRKAKSILKTQEDSEDAVQETFTKIYLNASKFEKQKNASFKSWGYKILINTSFTRYQKLKKKNENFVELTDDMQKIVADPASVEALSKRESLDYIASIMTQLPKALSRILHLHFIERRPQKEIARIENITVGAVKTRIYRAKREFRRLNSYYLV